ncbi:hypothetical protein GCM10009559_06100 [Pseudonocardia zijingensis]|uniref:UspA domain-containing protein n=1 Tax=Pseudonocardia zijingensis TaxID=153376 RepID=A0ABP3ZI67_9PSEU
MLGAARSQLADAAALAAELLPREQVEPDLIGGFPIPVLRAESQGAQLLVLGDRGYCAISGLLLGSVAAAMAAHAGCPIVLVRTEEETPVEDRSRPVVVGVDGSLLSEAALAFAYEQASARGVPLIAVHTWRDLILDAKIAPALDWDAVEAEANAGLAERLAGWGGEVPRRPRAPPGHARSPGARACGGVAPRPAGGGRVPRQGRCHRPGARLGQPCCAAPFPLLGRGCPADRSGRSRSAWRRSSRGTSPARSR